MTDDAPRFNLGACRLCGAPFSAHKRVGGGLYTRRLDSISAELVGYRIIIREQCVAAAFVDFERSRVEGT